MYRVSGAVRRRHATLRDRGAGSASTGIPGVFRAAPDCAGRALGAERGVPVRCPDDAAHGFGARRGLAGNVEFADPAPNQRSRNCGSTSCRRATRRPRTPSSMRIRGRLVVRPTEESRGSEVDRSPVASGVPALQPVRARRRLPGRAAAGAGWTATTAAGVASGPGARPERRDARGYERRQEPRPAGDQSSILHGPGPRAQFALAPEHPNVGRDRCLVAHRPGGRERSSRRRDHRTRRRFVSRVRITDVTVLGTLRGARYQ